MKGGGKRIAGKGAARTGVEGGPQKSGKRKGADKSAPGRKRLNKRVVAELREAVGAKHRSMARAELRAAAHDRSADTMLALRAEEEIPLPEAVIRPGSTEEVARILAIAASREIVVTPQGGGSGVVRGIDGAVGGIIIDLKRLNRVRRIDSLSLVVEVEAGLLGQRLEEILNAEGLTSGHRPEDRYSATIGGWLARRSAGLCSSRYGKIEDLCLGLEAVLPGGRIIKTRVAPRAATGPDLKHLLMGSEGALAVITAATFRIFMQPASQSFLAYSFDRIDAGLEAMRKIIQSGLQPAAACLSDGLEQLPERDGGELESALAAGGAGPERASARHGALLFLVFEGVRERAGLEKGLSELRCSACGGVPLGSAPARQWWQNRCARVSRLDGPGARPDAWVEKLDVAALWQALPEVYEKVREAVELLDGLTCAISFPHAYHEGCAMTVTLTGQGVNGKSRNLLVRAREAVLTASLAAGATVSHHRGIGRLHIPHFKQELGPAAIRALARVKAELDPGGNLNPGVLGLPPLGK